MYASVTDYAAVYNDVYRDRRGAHTSFNIGLLPTLLASFCRTAGVTSLLDVSGGQGRLIESLGRLGIRGLTTDICPSPGQPIIAFDLSRYSETDIARIRQEMERIGDGVPHLTCCLDVLEHIDREHVFAAVRNLANLSVRLLVVSILARPSSRDNLFHASIFPVSTWVRVFRAAGFRVLPTSHFDSATHHPTSERSVTDPLVDRWRIFDPFGDLHEGEPRYLVLEKTTDVPDWTLVEAEINELLDVAYRPEKRRQFQVQGDVRFLLSLHHVQEFAFLRPLLDVLPRDDLRVILRPHFIEERYCRAIIAFLARSGVRTHVYERADELPWAELAGRVLITAAESGCAVNHVHGLQISALGRLHGCRTYLLQHGIWPSAFHGRIVTFASETVLNWGASEERILQQRKHRVGAAEVPWGMFSPGQVRRIGSPRYTDQLLPLHSDGLDLRLGIERTRFASVVLLAIKKFRGRWGSPDVDETLQAGLLRVIETHPETLFLVRPHPAHDPQLLSYNKNVRFLDETCCIAADLPLSRIVPLVDLVITPISTIALDGAISNKPVIICESGQPRMYDHLEAVPVERLPEVLRSPEFLAQAAHRARLFRETYAEAVDARFYERFASLLAEPARAGSPPDTALATAVSLAAEAEQQWSELRRVRAEAQERIARLEAEAAIRDEAATASARDAEKLSSELERAQRAGAEADERIARLEAEGAVVRDEANASAKDAERLNSELETARLALEAMRRSTSWQITAPLRGAARLMRRLITHRASVS